MAKKRKPKPRVRRGELNATLSWFEIALGHDGLRGGPDPLILAGLYSIQGDEAKLLCRGLLRVEVKGPYPASVDGSGHSKNADLLSKDIGKMECLVLLVVALEEDGGSDTRRLYAELERARFTVWDEDDAEPTPYELAEYATAHPESSKAVEVLVEGESLRESCGDDELIGATVSVFHRPGRGKHARRLHFRAPNGKNDWTCEISLVVR